MRVDAVPWEDGERPGRETGILFWQERLRIPWRVENDTQESSFRTGLPPGE